MELPRTGKCDDCGDALPGPHLGGYTSAVRDLPSDLEREVVQRVRTEQQYLRDRLFGRQTQANCDLCGRLLPIDLLIG
jgi:hypothetical protein